MITLNRSDVGQMTGLQFMEAVGILKDSTWQHNDIRDFEMGGHTWHAYTTAGRGRKSGTTYVHLYRKTQLRIIDAGGADTGLTPVDDVIHYRGRMADKIATFRQVN